jgi:hypothetical protein
MHIRRYLQNIYGIDISLFDSNDEKSFWENFVKTNGIYL